MANEDHIRSVPMAQQKSEWIAMRDRITALVETTTASNVHLVADRLSKENLTDGRGLFCTAVLDSQSKSPESSDVYAALAAIINSRFPDAGYLLVKRAVLRFKDAYDADNKRKLHTTSSFVAHLVNQRVAYEVLALNVLMFLLVKRSADSVEVAAGFCRGCGGLLAEVAPRKLGEIVREFGRVVRWGGMGKRAEEMVEELVAAAGRRGFREEAEEYLDVVEEEDRGTHDVCLLQELDPETYLDEFVEGLVW